MNNIPDPLQHRAGHRVEVGIAEMPIPDLQQIIRWVSPVELQIIIARDIQNQVVLKITAIVGQHKHIQGPVLPELQVVPVEAIQAQAVEAALVHAPIPHQVAVLAEVVAV